MKILLVALITITTSTFAYSSSFSSGSCHIEINGGVSISESEIEFFKNNNHLYKIIDNKSLSIEGNKVSLTSSQHALINHYSNNIRELIPQTKSLATDTLTLASEGAYLIFNELLDEGNSLVEKLSVHFNNINDQIEESFTTKNVIHLDENGFSGKDFFGKEFEQHIEATVKEVLQNSMGSLMIAFGQELLFSGGNMEALENKVDRFSDKITQEVEVRSAAIKDRADKLCEYIIDIDDIEERIKKEIPELSKFDVLTVLEKTK